jgi:zinc transporter ZupT
MLLVIFDEKSTGILGWSVTLALLLHKIPESFGFGSYLSQMGGPKSLLLTNLSVSFCFLLTIAVLQWFFAFECADQLLVFFGCSRREQSR